MPANFVKNKNMELETKEKKAFAKLGFSKLETEKLVDNLNLALANYHLHYQKLRNFHWNIEGASFFELHEKFEEEYNKVQLRIDEIAERIRVFDKKPVSNLSDYLELSEIKESKSELSPKEMVKELLNDMEILLSVCADTIKTAEEIDDKSTEDLMIQFMQDTEKTHWMFTAWLKSK